MLIGKHKTAIKVKRESKEAYQDLTSSLDPALIKKWGDSQQLAESQRGDALKIYQVSLKQGQPDS
jgi:uncharacterized protein YeaC (DUF1315 family)